MADAEREPLTETFLIRDLRDEAKRTSPSNDYATALMLDAAAELTALRAQLAERLSFQDVARAIAEGGRRLAEEKSAAADEHCIALGLEIKALREEASKLDRIVHWLEIEDTDDPIEALERIKSSWDFSVREQRAAEARAVRLRGALESMMGYACHGPDCNQPTECTCGYFDACAEADAALATATREDGK